MAPVVRRLCLLAVGVAALALGGWPPAASASTTLDVPGSYATIQAAIDAAANGDTVLVAPGTYHESINFEGKAITVMSGQGPGSTIIDGTGLNSSVVTIGTGEGRGSVLQGFTIQHGNNTVTWNGGGVAISSASPTITGNVITGNIACGDGAGIDVQSGAPLITGNVITGNLQETGCSGGAGGGVALLGAPAQVIGNTITDNTNFWAGGISVLAAGATIANNVISGNSAQSQGGGIWSVDEANDLFVQNLITGNRSPDDGGGLFFSQSSGAPGSTIVDNTFANNSAVGGAAVYVGGFPETTQFFNNVFQSPSSLAAVFCDTLMDPNPPVLDHNDAFSAGGGPGFDGGCAGAVGTNGNISADPLLTSDFHLLNGSPAIDAGNDAAPDLPATDLAGNPRVAGAAVDLGVYEGGVSAPPPAGRVAASPSALAFGTLHVGKQSRAQTVTVSNAGTGPLHIGSLSLQGANAGDFAIVSSGCANATLAPGATCTTGVTFKPTARGARTAVLDIASDDPSSPFAISLSGTGG
jgi:hypothetical protein